MATGGDGREPSVNPAYGAALASSALFGAGDFAGGIAARRGPAPLVTAFSALGALALLLVGMGFIRGTPSADDLAWGAAAGACGAAGATLIYKSLALGPMSLASPVFCVIGLSVPVLVGVALGERPSSLAWTGVALAVVAIPLLSLTGEGPGHVPRAHVRRTLFVSIMAGLTIGWFLVCVARIGLAAGLLPLVVARGVALVLLISWYVARRRPALPPAAARPAALGAGVLDSSANVAYWLAVQSAPLALVSALVSLAPATTVLIARVTLGERWSAAQRVGLVVALAAGLCISLG
jgi:drug/metabolite transporter (DMT)-like permease